MSAVSKSLTRSDLLLFVHAPGHDLVDRTLYERGRDRFAASMPGGVVYQRTLVALEIAQQLTEVPLETPDAGHVANMLALRPATRGRELAPAFGPAPVPQAPLRTLQSSNRLVGQALVGRACAEATGRLQRVLEAHRGVPPVEHDRGVGQRLALQPPQPGVAVAQHGRRRVLLHASRGERLLERVGGDRGAVARESETGLEAMSVDHLACDHLKVTLLLPVPTADVAAIKPDHDGFGRLRRGRLCRLGGVRLYNGLADPQRPVPHRAGVLRPADRKQLRQQDCNLAERRQRGISRRHVRQFRRHGRRLEVEDGEAFCLARTLAGTGEQAPNPYRHVAEQGAERRGVMTLTGQNASASLARATTLANDGYLRRDHLRLERGCELLGLRKPEPEVGQAGLLIALEARDLHLRRQARLSCPFSRDLDVNSHPALLLPVYFADAGMRGGGRA